MNRRDFCEFVAGLTAVSLTPESLQGDTRSFRLRYIVASSMYGRMSLADVLPEIGKAGAECIDIWPERHANHREQIELMGHKQFTQMLRQHNVKLGILTRYDLGPFDLEGEMRVAKKLGGSMVVCGSRGPGNLKGGALRTAVRKFIEKMKPHIAAAEQIGITIGIENHGNSLIHSQESIQWLSELAPSGHIGIALAPYHLPQDPVLIARLITDLGTHLIHFYAWQYGMGCHKKLPKEQELLQLPGRGKLDFAPIIAALKNIDYKGWTEVFMHPVPRGIPIMPTAAQVTDQINLARAHLETCLQGPPRKT